MAAMHCKGYDIGNMSILLLNIVALLSTEIDADS